MILIEKEEVEKQKKKKKKKERKKEKKTAWKGKVKEREEGIENNEEGACNPINRKRLSD